MLQKNSNCREFSWVPKTLRTVSQWGFLKTKNSPGQERLFGMYGCPVNIHILLSFSSKSEHDNVGDQATLTPSGRI